MTHPLEEENRRLRAALEEIAKQKTDAELGDDGPFGSSYDFVEGYDCCIKTARAALAAEPASGEADTGSEFASNAEPLDSYKAATEAALRQSASTARAKALEDSAEEIARLRNALFEARRYVERMSAPTKVGSLGYKVLVHIDYALAEKGSA